MKNKKDKVITTFILIATFVLLILMYINKDNVIHRQVININNYQLYEDDYKIEKLNLLDYVEPVIKGNDGMAYIESIDESKLIDKLMEFEIVNDIDVDNKNVSSFIAKNTIKNNISYEYDKKDNLKNGDKIKVIAHVDSDKLIKLGVVTDKRLEKEFTISNLYKTKKGEFERKDGNKKILNLFLDNKWNITTINGKNVVIRDMKSKYPLSDEKENGFFIWYYQDGPIEDNYVNVKACVLTKQSPKSNLINVETITGNHCQEEKIKIEKLIYE